MGSHRCIPTFFYLAMVWISATQNTVFVVVRAEDVDQEAESFDLRRAIVHQQQGVLPLTDSTFEHATQASTGQTTGSWLVWFHGDDSDSVDMKGNFPAESEWLEHHVVVASVNKDGSGRETANRLQVKDIPSFLYIHKGKMYPYPTNDYYSWEDILAFCREPHIVSTARDIPAPPSLWDELRVKLTSASDSSSYILIAGAAIMVVVMAIFVAAVVGHFGSKGSADKTKGD